MCFQKVFRVLFTPVTPALAFQPASFLAQATLLYCPWPFIPLPPSWCFLLVFKLQIPFHAHACLPPTIFVCLPSCCDGLYVLQTGYPGKSASLPSRRVSHEILPSRSLKKCKCPLLKLKKNPRRYLPILKYHSCFHHIFPPRTWRYFPTNAAKNLRWTAALIKLVWKTKCCIKISG